MPYLKKLVLKGFKSFQKETEIPFANSMNVIIGPNGSGKSNITDAICFVLGRMSIKSMRAAKSSNLIFAGTKTNKPASEASVKLVFDNTDKRFSIDKEEITIGRMVRSNGQSIYKINTQVKTRQEVLELLAQAGIDPYGFNIVLQGEIDSIVKIHSEERRKIIEEVAGISIYETGKEKSLRELEKTEEKLKEVSATLRERTTYLKNLEEERKQALRFKKLQELVKRYKVSILARKFNEKKRELSNIIEQQEAKEEEKNKFKKKEQEIINAIGNLEKEISKINSQIQKSSGIEQEQLNREISDIRADLAGLGVMQDNNQEKISEISNKNEKLKQTIGTLQEHSKQENLGELRKELKLSLGELENLNTKREKQETEISIFNAEILSLEDIKKKVGELDICPLCKTKITKEHVKHVFSDCNKKISTLTKKIEENKQQSRKIKKQIENLQIRTNELQDALPEIEIKERDLESLKITIEQNRGNEEELRKELEKIDLQIQEKENLLAKKESEIKLIEKKYHSLIKTRTDTENQIRQNNSFLLEERNKIALIEEKINNLKIERAKLDAEKSNLEVDIEPYKGLSTINMPVYALEEKLQKTTDALENIGSVNLRALEVYDKMKEEYDKINEKVSVLEKEKAEILKIIEEIDKKKKRTFLKTLRAVNELFNRNFSQLYIKGEAFLELENEEDPFAGGLDIVIKVARGRYFDVNSLSGGEKTLVALSLIFAIQEYKPYCFYIFDEVDATLDKRNSERLAALIKRYMKTGQYLIVTHNDAIISESAILYGVSMQEGISKILSLEV